MQHRPLQRPTRPDRARPVLSLPGLLLLAGLLAVGPLLGGLAWLALVRDPQLSHAMHQELSGILAQQQARLLHTLEQGLRQRLENATHSPLVLRELEAGSEDFGAIEEELQAFFPELDRLRLIPVDDLGSALLREGTAGLRNHIEVDLVRRAAAGDPPSPEIYPHDDAVYTSLALLIAPEGDQNRHAVLLASIDREHLFAPLASASGPAGQVTIRQRYGDQGREVLHLGEAVSGRGASLRQHRSVPGSTWEVSFAPADSLLAGLHPGYREWVVVVGCGLMGILLAIWLLLRSLPGRLASGPAQAAAQAPPTAREETAAPPPAPFEEADLFAGVPGESAGQNGVSLPSQVFRAYDIRGEAEQELTDTLVYRVAQAIGTLAAEKNELTLVVASDGRRSSPRIRETLIQGLLATGRNVIDIGVVPTPLMYYATRHLNCGSGVVVTGSHNPPGDNGLKMVIKGQTLAAGVIQHLHQSAQNGNFCVGEGQLSRQDILPAYLAEVTSDVVLPVPLSVVVDAGNGATSEAAPALFSALGCEVLPLYCEIDGDFPNRSPDTSQESNLRDLATSVVQQQADFGVAFDGDGDRLAVVSPSGRILRTDELLMILARDVLSRNPGTDIVFDVKCSRELANRIVEDGGRPVLWKTGHALMKEKIAETGALLGGEFSGHVFYGERWYGFDDGLYAAARLAEILATQGQDLDSLVAEFPATVNTPELLLAVPEERKFSLIRQFTERADFPDGKINALDGVRVDYSDGWGLVRASNTTAALTARFEASDPERLAGIMATFRQQLAALDPPVTLPEAPGSA